MATVKPNWKGEDETINVGVIPNLGEDFILGTDYGDFTSLLEKAGQEHLYATWWEEALFGASEEETRKPRIKLSRKQKIEQRWEYQNLRDPRKLEPHLPSATVCTTTGDFRQGQCEDPTLKNAWHQAAHQDGPVRNPIRKDFRRRRRDLRELKGGPWWKVRHAMEEREGAALEEGTEEFYDSRKKQIRCRAERPSWRPRRRDAI
ncbi:hypothetical protein NDU88_006260 [Pleurodeles waltl]|uniref:Uncharacterized protein n=1 Tax=Pleurodeles waltl TaxID=8319 RepID=A0AAV7UKH3_PLEWA|nr:hypothetical protein NDU88_006260 [Pleurodeles waltl]